jgi:integrase
MGRKVRDTSLETRNARLKLPTGGKPRWRILEAGLHLGYRRPKDGKGSGTWIARRYIGQGSYEEKRVGIADDFMGADEGVTPEADERTIRNFSQAQDKARSWWGERRNTSGFGGNGGPYTVLTACGDYLKHYTANGGKDEYGVRQVIEVHIHAALGDLEVAKLTTRKLRDWHHGLAAAPRRLRTSKFAKVQKTKAIRPDDEDEKRSRKATANRILTVLKAALNHAYHERHVANADAWRAVKSFKKVDAPVVRYLSADECRRLVNASPADLRPLVQAALLTGCRYGELSRLRCDDVNLDAQSIAIRQTKGGKPRHVVLTSEGIAFFSSLVAGRKPRDLLLQRKDGGPWKAAQQTRPLKEACAQAQIAPAVGFHVLRHTHASILAMKGVPMGVIAAQLGHADTRITERHYAHLAPSYIADTIRGAFPDLGIAGERTVISLTRAR